LSKSWPHGSGGAKENKMHINWKNIYRCMGQAVTQVSNVADGPLVNSSQGGYILQTFLVFSLLFTLSG
jgi:hypothetical protein